MSKTKSMLALLLLLAASCQEATSFERGATSTGRPIGWIRSRQLSAMVYLPDPSSGHYRGPRFDWSGMVGEVTYDGKHFFGPLYPGKDDPRSHDYNATGPADEFGMTSPIGYDKAGPGGTFIKIGVGHLLRPANEAQYQFYHNYKVVTPAAWEVDGSREEMRFRQRLSDPRGWGYDYIKTVALSDDSPEMTVSHRLTNTGTRRIDTDVYCHNIVQFDRQGTLPGMYIGLPTDVSAVNEEGQLQYLSSTPRRVTVVTPLVRDESAKGEWQPASNRPLDYSAEVGNGVQTILLTGDRPPAAIKYYISAAATCVEPFLAIRLDPGESYEWTVRYRFATTTLAKASG